MSGENGRVVTIDMKRIRDSKNLHSYPSLIANMQVRLCGQNLCCLHRDALRENGFIRSLTHFKCFFYLFYSRSGFWIHSYLTIVQLFIYFFQNNYTIISIYSTRMARSNKWPCTLFCVYDFFFKVLFPSCLLLFGMKKDFFTSMAKLFVIFIIS